MNIDELLKTHYIVPKQATIDMLKAGVFNYESGKPYQAYRFSEVNEIFEDMCKAAPKLNEGN